MRAFVHNELVVYAPVHAFVQMIVVRVPELVPWRIFMSGAMWNGYESAIWNYGGSIFA